MFNMKRSVKMKNIFGMAVAILMAAFGLVSLTSCENELAEQFTVEVIVDEDSGDTIYTLDDIDYFVFDIEKFDGIKTGRGGEDVPVYTTVMHDVYLDKGKVLRLENVLEPGMYQTSGYAYQKRDDYAFDDSIAYVKGKSNNMTTISLQYDEGENYDYELILVERGVPMAIKFCLTFYPGP